MFGVEPGVLCRATDLVARREIQCRKATVVKDGFGGHGAVAANELALSVGLPQIGRSVAQSSVETRGALNA
jgi:hypothetical protein